jgi:hypothetical protein
MRNVLIASLVAAGIGLLAGSSGMAAPVSNAGLKNATPPLTEQMQQVGWRGHRCHVRWRSWWRHC